MTVYDHVLNSSLSSWTSLIRYFCTRSYVVRVRCDVATHTPVFICVSSGVVSFLWLDSCCCCILSTVLHITNIPKSLIKVVCIILVWAFFFLSLFSHIFFLFWVHLVADVSGVLHAYHTKYENNFIFSTQHTQTSGHGQFR